MARIKKELFEADTGTQRRTAARFVQLPAAGRQAIMPSYDHPAVVEGRTTFKATVKDPATFTEANVFKSAIHNSKIGYIVLKGEWRGMKVYTLSLEERATCPKECILWRCCYGNNMPFVHRMQAGPALEARIPHDLAKLDALHPKGFVIRLHVVGDFYSPEYVALWRNMLDKFPTMRVYGYTSRYRAKTCPISAALVKLVMERWEQFAVRFSNAPVDECATVTIEHLAQRPADAIVCPQQTGGTEACATCALCWDTKKRIAFIRH